MKIVLLAGVVALGAVLAGSPLAGAGERSTEADHAAEPAHSALVVSIPNHRSKAEARRQVDKALSDLQRDYGFLVTIVHEAWTGDRLRLRATVLGQAAVGHIDVKTNRVSVRVLFPGSLTFLVDMAQPAILKAGTQMLAKK